MTQADLSEPLRAAGVAAPNAPALIHGPTAVTHAHLAERCGRLAMGLMRQGLPPGSRLAVLAQNSASYLEVLYAALWARLVVVPLNTRWSDREIAFALEDCGAAGLAVDATFAGQVARLAEQGAQVGQIVALGREIPGRDWPATDLLVHLNTPAPLVALPREGLAGIFYTGGTTGRAKGVVLSHANLAAGAAMVREAAALGTADRYLHVAPMFHLADAAMTFAVTQAGGAQGFLPAFDPAGFAAAVARDRITHVVLVPTMIGRLMQSPHVHSAQLASLRRIIYGAAPMPEALIRALAERLPHVGLIQAYGQTELAPVATCLRPEDHVRGLSERPEILRSAGRPVRGVRLEVVDEAGLEQPAGEVGHIRVRGPNAASRYWRREPESHAVFRDGWVMTGDLGFRDEEDFVHVVDRAKDMIICGGENVYSAEVENALAEHPAVAECAVVGAPDPDLGERVHAVVVAGQAVTEDELVAHCRALIAGYKRPRSFDIRREPLPRNAAGKVIKDELRAALKAVAETQGA